jgi:lipopolysaccharide transport system permease protein
MVLFREKTVIKPPSRFPGISFREIYEYRDLLYFLVWRDIKVRYKQTVIGVAWVILQPIVSMMVFAILFGKIARLPSEGIPYAVFTYSALLPWQLFSYTLTQSSQSLVSDEKLITKIYFPRILIPMAPIFSGLFDFLISWIVFIPILLFYRIIPGATLIYLPFFILLTVLTSLGVGLWLTALNVRFRDVRYAIPFFTQVWFYLTPVAYSATLIPESWHWLYRLNPMVGIVQGFRWTLLETTAPTFSMLAVSMLVTVVFLLIGMLYFQRVEGEFADII